MTKFYRVRVIKVNIRVSIRLLVRTIRVIRVIRGIRVIRVIRVVRVRVIPHSRSTIKPRGRQLNSSSNFGGGGVVYQ